MMSRTASAPMPAWKTGRPGRRCRTSRRGRGTRVSPRVMQRLEALDLVARLADLVLEALGLRRASLLRSCRSVVVDARPGGRRSSGSTARASSASRLLELRVDPLGLGRRRSCAAAAVASLPALSPAATTTSPVGSKAIVSSAAPVLSAARLRPRRPGPPRRSASVRSARWASSSALRRGELRASARPSVLLRSARSSSSSSAEAPRRPCRRGPPPRPRGSRGRACAPPRRRG